MMLFNEEAYLRSISIYNEALNFDCEITLQSNLASKFCGFSNKDSIVDTVEFMDYA